MADEHVNAVLESTLARENFSLLIFAKELSDVAFTRWSKFQQVIIVTENRCSMHGEIGNGAEELWNFESLIECMER